MEPRSITIHQHPVVIRRAKTEELIDLRHCVLRAGLPREEAFFPGDDFPTTRHFGAFNDSSAVCCATFHRDQYEGQPAWRLRGMATDERFRSQGIGREVLNYAEQTLRADDSIGLLWCNARIAAVKFYQSQGWTIVSDLFDIPTAGPHHRMVKRINLEMKSSPTGRGVFATTDIPRGGLLLPFTGPLLRYNQTTPQTLALQIGPDLYVGESGGLDDCVNHSCDPNAGLVISGTDVRLFSLRDIAPGEQITFDYSTTMDEDDFEFDCLCGSSICRRRIRDFKHLPEEFKRKYLALGVVPEYLRGK